MLEHEADVALAHVRAGRVLAVEQDLALVGELEPGDDAQERGLAAARGPEQRHQLAGRERQAHVVERDEAAERLADILNLDAHAASIGVSSRPARHSMIVLITSVTKARNASSEATANAAANWYSL